MDWFQTHVRLFRALLYCYPGEFRHEYASEMEQIFADRLRSEPRLRLWLDSVTDILISAPREHLHVLRSDIRFGARILASTPGFTLIALLVMSLGIGATVSVFSLVDAVLLRSLPYAHPKQLVYIWSPNRNFKGVPDQLGPNVPDFYSWQHLSRSFSAMTMFELGPATVVLNGAASRVGAARVTGSFFRTLDVSPAMGRTIESGDDQPGHGLVAVVSDRFWRSHLNASPRVIGSTLQINRKLFTVIGVMPKQFGYPFAGDVPYESLEFPQTDIWYPVVFTANQQTDRRNFASANAIARLRPGVSVASAQSEMRGIESRLQPLYPEMWRGWTILLGPLVDTIIGPVQQMLWLLLGAVALVLLIAVANVANLLLSRYSARAHELGIRRALGAERARIIRQLLTESLLLSCAGGTLGILLAYGIVHALKRLNPGDIPRFESTAVDGRVLLVALVLTIGAGVAAGLAPALAASRAAIADVLKAGGRHVSGTFTRARSGVIVIQVALSVVLLSGAGLMIRSYIALAAVNPGFASSTLTFRVPLDERYKTPEQRNAFYRTFLARLRNLPGIGAVGASSSTPLSHDESVTFAEIRGWGESSEMVERRAVTPGYFNALGTPMLRGRDFSPHDTNAKPPVVLVNKRFADLYFPRRDPLGGEVRLGIGDSGRTPWATVVGVVGNIRQYDLEKESKPQVFQPEDSGDNFAIQSSASMEFLTSEARSTLHSLDPNLVLNNVRTMRERVAESKTRRNFQTVLLTGFAIAAVVLALVGLYGLISYSVKTRTAELGVRLALGCSRARILRLVLVEGLRVVTVGLALGLVGTFALTRLLSGWLFGVKATDPVTFIVVSVFLVLIAAAACIIPALSAARLDPVETLRQE